MKIFNRHIPRDIAMENSVGKTHRNILFVDDSVCIH